MTPSPPPTQPIHRARRWRPWPRRLYPQLVLTMALLVLGAMAVLGAYTAQGQTALALEAAKARQSVLARHLALACGNLILTSSMDQIEELALRTVEFPDVKDIQVLDSQGRVLTHVIQGAGGLSKVVVDPVLQRVPLPDLEAASQGEFQDRGAPLLRAWHPVRAGAVVGWVRVEQGLESLAPVRTRILVSTAVVAVLAVLASTVLLVVRVRPAMRALDDAARFAVGLTQVSAQQLPVPEGPQEIHTLAKALNLTSRRLSQQLQEVESVMQRLEFNETQLSQQNEQLHAIFALSPDGLAILDDGGQVTFANEAFFQLTGLGADEVLDRREVQISHSLRSRLVAGGEGAGGREWVAPAGSEGDSVFDTGLGTEAARVYTLTVQGEIPRVLGVTVQASSLPSVSKVIFVADLTRQHQLDQMKSEFLSMAAHELRTPMASIFGFTELMLRREMSAEQRQDLLGRMHRQSQLMINILNELLDLARIESRRGQDFQMQEFDLAHWLAQVLADHAPPEGRTPVALDASAGAGGMAVRADPDKLRQALSNVLSNAYKYSPAGGAVVVRLLRQATPEGHAEFGLEVEDHGLGLTPEELARLGERFFRADKSGNIPGTGLGVSIVRELLGLMDGRMAVRSQAGQGTVVTLWLPGPIHSVGVLASMGVTG